MTNKPLKHVCETCGALNDSWDYDDIGYCWSCGWAFDDSDIGPYDDDDDDDDDRDLDEMEWGAGPDEYDERPLG